MVSAVTLQVEGSGFKSRKPFRKMMMIVIVVVIIITIDYLLIP